MLRSCYFSLFLFVIFCGQRNYLEGNNLKINKHVTQLFMKINIVVTTQSLTRDINQYAICTCKEDSQTFVLIKMQNTCLFKFLSSPSPILYLVFSFKSNVYNYTHFTLGTYAAMIYVVFFLFLYNLCRWDP